MYIDIVTKPTDFPNAQSTIITAADLTGSNKHIQFTWSEDFFSERQPMKGETMIYFRVKPKKVSA